MARQRSRCGALSAEDPCMRTGGNTCQYMLGIGFDEYQNVVGVFVCMFVCVYIGKALHNGDSSTLHSLLRERL